MKKLLLGTHSPRRIELLTQMGVPFSIVDIPYEEEHDIGLSGYRLSDRMAVNKARFYIERHSLSSAEVLLTADTVVCIKENGSVSAITLGKPQDIEDAKTMLMSLSDREHIVWSSFSLSYWEDGRIKIKTYHDKTEVYFNRLTEAEADYYVKHCNVLDKAGAYGIQDRIGLAKIRKINGSFYTVMGLPAHMVYEELQKLQVI